VLLSTERAQGGLAVDNITYMATDNVAAVPFPTSDKVVILALGGNLNIRRGPGADYNPVGAFLDGEATIASARNAGSTWLYVSIPNTSDQFGWINITTQLTHTTGNMGLLPVKTVEPALPAYVRNCTAGMLFLRPGDIKIEDRLKAPNNITLVYPGDYELFDPIKSTSSAIKALLIREGDTVDITADGSNKTYTCP